MFSDCFLRNFPYFCFSSFLLWSIWGGNALTLYLWYPCISCLSPELEVFTHYFFIFFPSPHSSSLPSDDKKVGLFYCIVSPAPYFSYLYSTSESLFYHLYSAIELIQWIIYETLGLCLNHIFFFFCLFLLWQGIYQIRFSLKVLTFLL